LFGDATFSYGDVDRVSNRIANLLRDLGVRPNDRVALLLPNSEHFVHCWIAAIKPNATMVPLNVHAMGDTLRYLLGDSGARVLITTQALLRNVLAVRESLPAGCQLIVIDRVAGPRDSQTDTLDFQALVDDSSEADPPDVPSQDEDIAMIIYTSGTTGRPKGVMLNRRVQTNHLLRYRQELLMTAPHETAYTYLPLFHVTSLGVTMGNFSGGARVALDTNFDVFSFLSRIRRFNAIVFPYLGAVISMLHARPAKADDADNPARRALGAAAPAAIWRSFGDRFGLELLETYGQTEWGALWVMHPRGRSRVGTAGTAPKEAERRVMNEQGALVPPGTTGELEMKPAHAGLMMSGYVNIPEPGQAVFRDGWYRTGDLGAIDTDGYLRFKGRLKDYIRRRGENIAAIQIESVANQHSAILESAAVGVPSELGEEEVKLCVVLRSKLGDALAPEMIWRYCRERLPRFMVPRFIEVMSALSKTETQRVRKFILAERGVALAWDRASRTG
jgi:crotonobetaine/carnitine-CoA ligase